MSQKADHFYFLARLCAPTSNPRRDYGYVFSSGSMKTDHSHILVSASIRVLILGDNLRHLSTFVFLSLSHFWLKIFTVFFVFVIGETLNKLSRMVSQRSLDGWLQSPAGSYAM